MINKLLNSLHIGKPMRSSLLLHQAVCQFPNGKKNEPRKACKKISSGGQAIEEEEYPGSTPCEVLPFEITQL
jgi:hypothetical protein